MTFRGTRGYIEWKPPTEEEARELERDRGFREMWGEYYPVAAGKIRIRRRAASVMTTNYWRG